MYYVQKTPEQTHMQLLKNRKKIVSCAIKVPPRVALYLVLMNADKNG